MANGWTSERKAKQAMLVRQWRLWERSTGPRTPESKARASRNAYTGATSEYFVSLRKYLMNNIG